MALEVGLKVLEHHKLSALVTLLSSAATVVLVLGEVSHGHMSGAPLAQGGPQGALIGLPQESQGQEIQGIHLTL